MTNAIDVSRPKPTRRATEAKPGFPRFKSGKAAASAAVQTADPAPPAPQHPGTKRSTVIVLLQRESGASLAELVTATGWLPHTVRTALTGLRKRGMTVTRTKTGDETRYVVTKTEV